MNRQETAIGNGSRWLDGLVVLDEPSLGLSPVLVTEVFRCPMSALGH
jgi:ABC-type branched-subunit amino acid transport system ATPase component